MIDDRQEMGQITLEDVADLRPPTYMNQTTDLQTFRCTDNREFTKQDNPDKYATAIHDLWTQVKKCGQTMKRGNTTDLIKSAPPTEATPLPHTRTPERPTPTPRRLFKKRKVTPALKGPEGTQHVELGQPQGHLKPTPPPGTRSPSPSKTTWYLPHQLVKMQPLHELPPSKKSANMQCSDTPNRKRVILILGISFLLLMVAGVTAFGVITSNLQPVMDEETFTKVSGHLIQRRETNTTAMDDPNDVNTIISLAKQKAERRTQALQKLNNGQTPIQIWINDVASISFFTNLGGLEEDFNEALELLDTAFFSMAECLDTFTNTSSWDSAKDLCEKTIFHESRRTRRRFQ